MLKITQGNHKLLLVAIVLATAGIIVSGLELTNTTHLIHKAKPKVAIYQTAGQETKGEPQSNPTASSATQTSSDQPGDNKANPETTSNLIDPSGNFVSNHHPNLSGSPAPNQIQSTCTTTTGATCQIIFTNGSTTKSLAAQVTDRGGATYWTWKLQDIGLTAGSWKVQAKAMLNGQTKVVDDALPLEVSS